MNEVTSSLRRNAAESRDVVVETISFTLMSNARMRIVEPGGAASINCNCFVKNNNFCIVV